LCEVPADEIHRKGGERLGEAIARLRRGEVRREPGYDGEYGTIRLFSPGELDVGALFAVEQRAGPAPAA
jgi:PHP family Zn ribbon phosphoesterase